MAAQAMAALNAIIAETTHNRPPPGVNVVDNQAETPADLNE